MSKKMDGKKTVNLDEALERIKRDGVSRFLIAYDDSGRQGKCVLEFKNGRFTRLLTVGNKPNLTWVKQIEYNDALFIIQSLSEGIYKNRIIYMDINEDNFREVV